MFRQSYAVCDSVADNYKADFDLGFIHLFAGGSAPASPHDAETGTLLAIISVDSTATGITWDAAVASSRKITKAAAETWSGVCVLTAGTSMVATHARIYSAAHTTGASTTAKRIDVSVTPSGGGGPVTMANTTVTGGATVTIDTAYIEVPAQ